MNSVENKNLTEGPLLVEIMKNITEGIYLIRLDDSTIVYTNERFEKMFGYEPGEMIGKNVAIVNAHTELSPEDTKKSIVDILVKNGEWHGEVENIKKDGTHFWCYANVSLFNSTAFGKVIVSVHTDITKQKDQEKDLLELNFYLNNIINSIADPIFVKDSNFRFLLANDALCKMLGMNLEDILGKTLAESLPKDEMDHFLAVDKKVLDSGETDTSEEKLTGKDSHVLTIVTKKTRFTDQKGNKFLVGVIRDVTAAKLAQEEILQHTKELEKINKIMVDRELKMAELKKEVEELKSSTI